MPNTYPPSDAPVVVRPSISGDPFFLYCRGGIPGTDNGAKCPNQGWDDEDSARADIGKWTCTPAGELGVPDQCTPLPSDQWRYPDDDGGWTASDNAGLAVVASLAAAGAYAIGSPGAWIDHYGNRELRDRHNNPPAEQPPLNPQEGEAQQARDDNAAANRQRQLDQAAELAHRRLAAERALTRNEAARRQHQLAQAAEHLDQAAAQALMQGQNAPPAELATQIRELADLRREVHDQAAADWARARQQQLGQAAEHLDQAAAQALMQRGGAPLADVATRIRGLADRATEVRAEQQQLEAAAARAEQQQLEAVAAGGYVPADAAYTRADLRATSHPDTRSAASARRATDRLRTSATEQRQRPETAFRRPVSKHLGAE
jgi:hypothetical protein